MCEHCDARVVPATYRIKFAALLVLHGRLLGCREETLQEAATVFLLTGTCGNLPPTLRRVALPISTHPWN